MEIEAWRFGYFLFDPFIAVLDADRFELVTSDDSYLNQQDGYCLFTAPEDGSYYIQVRETSYLGGANGHYRLHLGEFPRPAVAYPAGGQAGTELSFNYLNLDGSATEAELVLPADPQTLGVYAKRGEISAPSPNWLRVSPFGNVLETEPNNSFKEATDSGTQLPIALNGIIGEDGDRDYFKITLKKDQSVNIAVHARSIRSPLDRRSSVSATPPENRSRAGRHRDPDPRQPHHLQGPRRRRLLHRGP